MPNADKHTISFVNPNFQQGPKEYNAYYLPYSVGVLWTYATSQSCTIANHYTLDSIIWRREQIDSTAARLCTNDIVAFSTYIWNKSYNYALAKRIKERNPNCLILFGGPEPPIEDPNIFKRYPFIDLIVCYEGEVTFKEVLEAYHHHDDFMSIPGLLINQAEIPYKTTTRDRIQDIDDIPSPHLTGFFDKIMEDNPDVEWNAVLETNRGCPYQCTFCDWGSLTYNKVKKFNLDRVLAEFEWIGKHKIGFATIADANFGIFPDRDNVIADKLIEIQQTYGYPNAYTISWAKNQKSEVIEIVKKLVTKGKSRGGLTVSVQSLDDRVLKNVKRNNMAINQIEDIFKICDAENIPVVSELILGLPGETLVSWKENYYRLFRANNHTGISTYNAQLLENAEMNLNQRKFYKLETTVVRDYLCGTNALEPLELEEGVEIVKSTRDMPYEQLLDAIMFTWFVNTFHINGLSNMLSRFAYKYSNIDYRDFYDTLYDYLLKNNDWFAVEAETTRNYYDEWFTTGRITHPNLGSTAIYGMNLGQRTSIAIHTDVQYEAIFTLLKEFYTLNYPDHNEYITDLFELQQNYYIRHTELKNYPKQILLQHNILGYIQNNDPLHTPANYTFDFPEDKDMTLLRFCENSWFGRRRNFGKATIHYANIL
jgi:radical SAM superfamily enzyme YgiQ (UPF0313 family)